MICNFCLCVLKITGGIAASSNALISDGLNSAFDVISGIIVIIGAGLSRKSADTEHPYGHERIESVATIILAVILFVTAVFIGHTAVEDLIDGSFRNRPAPGVFSLIAALISIATKEILYHYTKNNAKKINSVSLKAEAWDHLADVIATAGALIGIMLSRYGFPAGDLIASIIVCLFIVRTAFMSFREAIGQMVDKSCDSEMLEELRECILSVDGVLNVDMLQVRTFGNKYYVDLEISEDENVSLKRAHDVAEEVHDKIEENFKDVKHIMVHVNPMEVD